MVDWENVLKAQIVLMKRRDSSEGRILRWLKKHGPATYAMLSYDLALRYDTVQKHILRLQEDDLIEVEKKPGPYKATVKILAPQ